MKDHQAKINRCYFEELKKLLTIIFFIHLPHFIFSQTFGWSGFPSGGTSYTNGIMTTTVTSTSPGFKNGSPKYYAVTTVGDGGCGIAGGLALEQNFGNITDAHVTLSMDFTSDNSTNGTCSVISFVIKDINAEETYRTFRDIVHISAIDANNANIPVANITTSGGSNKAISTSGSTRIIAGSFGSYASRSTTSCDDVTITITPPTGVPLKRIVLRYQPSYEACTNCYYNLTGPNRPAYQYISIGSLTASASGGGCSVGLPIEITSFTGRCENNKKTIEWVTATETNNDFFTIEHSRDGLNYEEAGHVTGAGNSASSNYYKFELGQYEEYRYYRLRQTDYDGTSTMSEPLYVYCSKSPSSFIRLYPNPAENELSVSFMNKTNEEITGYIINLLGERVKAFPRINVNEENLSFPVQELSSGIYYFAIVSAKTGALIGISEFVKK
jgi:hypothetical protein